MSTPEDVIVRRAREADFYVMVEIDDDATRLYASAGVIIDLPVSHPFTVAERGRWLSSVRAGRSLLAVKAENGVGFTAVDLLDGDPYLDQLSVRGDAMRRGIGRLLLRESFALAREIGGGAVWLTTYGDLPWNRPFYESEGFVVVPEHLCGEGVRDHLATQRAALPLPETRVAMRRILD